jgi:hypothetical protein
MLTSLRHAARPRLPLGFDLIRRHLDLCGLSQQFGQVRHLRPFPLPARGGAIVVVAPLIFFKFPDRFYRDNEALAGKPLKVFGAFARRVVVERFARLRVINRLGRVRIGPRIP